MAATAAMAARAATVVLVAWVAPRWVTVAPLKARLEAQVERAVLEVRVARVAAAATAARPVWLEM